MDLKNHTTPETVRLIFEHYEAQRKSSGGHRPHLGGSQIGRECSRALWYQFRHAWTPQFEGRMLRLFETGDREEGRIVRNLRDIGVEVWERDPDTGMQPRFTACGGHFALSLDGVGEGFPESKKPHTLEFKTMNTKNFKALSNLGLERAQPIYWAQVHVGMHLSGLERCYFFAVCKETDAIYGERVKLDKALALQLLTRADGIVFADEPPERLGADMSDYRCKFCPYISICHGCKIPEVNCRTCAHVTPERDGTWSCAKGHEVDGPCTEHLFIPAIMPKGWEVLDASPDRVEYSDEEGEVVVNQENSVEMHKGRMIRDSD